MDGKAAYEHIAKHYRDLILSGVLGVGQQLPTYMELGTAWGVTRATAGRAIELLRNEGLVSTEGRNGTRVRGVASTTVAIALDYKGLMVQSTRVIEAVPHVALELGIEPGTTVLLVTLTAGRDS